MKKNTIITFGEIVWDQFPDTSVLGGAPLNVTYHLNKQEWPALLVSRTGNDALGRQTLEYIKNLGLDTRCIQQDSTLATGTVTITFNQNNEHDFVITDPAAWDAIDKNEMIAEIKENTFHLVFGTLSQRHETSRQTLKYLWEKATTIFYDVNLRPPFTSMKNVFESLKASNIVKVNNEELLLLGQEFSSCKKPVEIAQNLLETFNLSMLAVTEGSNGAWLCHKNGITSHPGFPVQVVDTIGSGDAFFAKLITGILEGVPLDECLEKANRLGADIASNKGAIPV